MIEDRIASDLRASRMIEIIYPQTIIGATAVMCLCTMFGLIFVKSIGWTYYLAWYCVVTFGIIGRQIFFKLLLSRKGRPTTDLRLISWISAMTGSIAIAGLPLFARSISLSDVAVLSAIMVGWVASGVALLWVDPKIYAAYVLFNMVAIFFAWVGHAETTSLLPLGFALIFGSALLISLAQLVSRQQTQLEKMTAGKGRLLAAANHDFRQPAHALGLFMSRLKESPGDKSLIEGAEG